MIAEIENDFSTTSEGMWQLEENSFIKWSKDFGSFLKKDVSLAKLFIAYRIQFEYNPGRRLEN